MILPCKMKRNKLSLIITILPPDHPFRRNKYAFRKNRMVTYPPPKIRFGVELLMEIDALGLKKATKIRKMMLMFPLVD